MHVISLVFNCRGGAWYVMCAMSVAVTSLCAHHRRRKQI